MAEGTVVAQGYSLWVAWKTPGSDAEARPVIAWKVFDEGHPRPITPDGPVSVPAADLFYAPDRYEAVQAAGAPADGF